MEIERKFILNGFPDGFKPLKECVVRQYFLSVDPYIRVSERTSSGGAVRKLTIKGKGTMSRSETEFILDEAQFDELSALCGYPPVKKIFKTYALPGGYTFECNAVDPETPDFFYYGEIEFKSEEEAEAFVPPFDFIREVTFDGGYQMNVYWEKTRIKKEHFEI